MLQKLLKIQVKEYVRYGIFTLLWFFKLYYFAKTLGFHFMEWNKYLVNGGSILLISFWILLLNNKKKGLIIVDVILTILLIGDVLYYRYFGDFLSLALLQQVGQVGDITDSIFALFQWSDLWFLATFPLYFIPFKEEKMTWPWKIGLSVGTLLIGLVMFFQPVNEYVDKYGKNLFVNNWWNVSIYDIIGITAFHAYDSYMTIQDWVGKADLTEEDIADLEDFLAKKQQETAIEFGKYEGKNLIVIQLEAIQSFLIGRTIHGQEITPNLNEFVQEMYYFPNAYHQTFQGRTSDAEFVMNTSLYPVTKGVAYKRFGHHTYPSIPGTLYNLGYSTMVFHPWEKSFWNRTTVYKNYPFEKYFGIDDFESEEIVGWSVGDEPMLLEMVDHLKEAQPFYGFAITLTSHHPYTIDGKYHEMNVEGIEDWVLRNYIQAAHYVDKALGTFKEKMIEEGLWDETIVVIYGDHDAGIVFSENDRKLLNLGNDPLTDWNLKKGIAFFVHVPNQVQGETITHPVGQADIAPTVLSWLGIERPKGMLGQHILEDEKYVFFRDASFVSNDYIFQASIDGYFEKGTCMKLETGELVDVNNCRAPYDEGLKTLRQSDKIVEHNYFGK